MSDGIYTKIRITTTDQYDLLVFCAPDGFGLLPVCESMEHAVSHYTATSECGGFSVGLAWVEVPL